MYCLQNKYSNIVIQSTQTPLYEPTDQRLKNEWKKNCGPDNVNSYFANNIFLIHKRTWKDYVEYFVFLKIGLMFDAQWILQKISLERLLSYNRRMNCCRNMHVNRFRCTWHRKYLEADISCTVSSELLKCMTDSF